jgi:hypothetical protein
MDALEGLDTAGLLSVLDIPKDGRMLTFGAASAVPGMEIAAQRPDVLIVVCDTTSEVTRSVSDRSLAEGLNNVIVGDSPAGPLVDRALCVNSLHSIAPPDLVTIRTAMLPGGYGIFMEQNVPAQEIAQRLKSFGFSVADPLDGVVAGWHVVRAR